MHATAPAAVTAFSLCALGSYDALSSRLARTNRGTTAGALVSATVALCEGDVRAAEAALQHAVAHAAESERAYAVDLLADFFVARGRLRRAEQLLGTVPAGADLAAARVALAAVIHAAAGAPAAAVRDATAARALLAHGRGGTAERIRVATRLAQAALFRSDAGSAHAEVARGLRLAHAVRSARAAARLDLLAYRVARRLRGDAAGAWRHAVAAERHARHGGDAALRTVALGGVYELAGERADERWAARAGATRVPRDTVSARITDALRAAWRGELLAARAVLKAAVAAGGCTAGEGALCRALTALTALALGDDRTARQAVRRALSAPSQPGRHVGADELRRRRLARALGAVAGELVGDVARARRAADARSLRDDRDAAALWERRHACSADAFPATVRGYARLALIARDRLAQRPVPGPLTHAEAEILRAIAAGRSVVDIATSSGRSPHTVRTHLRNASAKLDAHGRSDLLARARALGAL